MLKKYLPKKIIFFKNNECLTLIGSPRIVSDLNRTFLILTTLYKTFT